MLNQFNTDENFLSSSYSAIVLQKPSLYLQNISIKFHQQEPVLICIRPAPSHVGGKSSPAPPAAAAAGTAGPSSTGGRVPKKGPKESLKTKECTQN